jgi:type IV secretory pathway VirB10-like protein
MPASPRLRLGALAARALSTLALTFVGSGCDDPPPPLPPPPAPAPTTAATGTGAPAPSALASSAPRAPEREIAGAAQILVAWKGADHAPKAVTRSKTEAKARAEEARAKLTDKGEPFEKLVKEYSDDEATRAAGGAIGNFERNAMPEAFASATFALEVGAISAAVETPAGYAIIKRTR